MLAYTYVKEGVFALQEKSKPTLQNDRDAIVKVTLGSICTSDLHIKHGSVPRAVPGITVGHEMVGIVEQIGSAVTTVRPGDRVAVNVETFCGECFFCRHGWVNNCTDPNGGWALGCRIDGGQAEYVRVPYADQGLTPIPDTVTDEQALFVGDVLATGYWAAQISEITSEDTVLILGAGPTGLCTLQCVQLYSPKRVIVCDKDPARLAFVQAHYPTVLTSPPENLPDFVAAHSDHGGADTVLEVYLPAGVAVCPPQCHCNGGGAVRRPPDPAPAGYVRQEPDFQDGRRGRLPLQGNAGPDRRRQAGHHPADHPHLRPEGH